MGRASRGSQLSLLPNSQIPVKYAQLGSLGGSFLNYVDHILPLLTTFLPPVDIGEGIHLLLKICILSDNISSTTYLPRLVNVAKERPPGKLGIVL